MHIITHNVPYSLQRRWHNSNYFNNWTHLIPSEAIKPEYKIHSIRPKSTKFNKETLLHAFLFLNVLNTLLGAAAILTPR